MQQIVPRHAVSHYHPVYTVPKPRLSGLGLTQQQVAQWSGTASVGVGATIAVLGSAGVITAATAATLVPVIGAAIAGITLGIEAILNSGCGQSCVMTSQWAEQAGDLLNQNIHAYFALPMPRPLEAKAVALSNFDQIWNGLVQRCSQAGLSTAGENCIGDRQQGACKWRQTGQPEFPGQPAYGECWNYWNSFRDPIANDPHVQTALQASTSSLVNAGGTISTVLSSIAPSGSPVWLIAGIGLLAWGVLS